MKTFLAKPGPEGEAVFETINQYFVIEFWVEQAASERASAAWRARVTHGPSGERWVVRSMGDLAKLMSDVTKFAD